MEGGATKAKTRLGSRLGCFCFSELPMLLENLTFYFMSVLKLEYTGTKKQWDDAVENFNTVHDFCSENLQNAKARAYLSVLSLYRTEYEELSANRKNSTREEREAIWRLLMGARIP
jgi:hypothetical protein